MTMKKLGLSLVTASMLATSAFATNSLENNDTITFNSHYTMNGMSADQNISLGLDYNLTTAAIGSGNYIILALGGDVAFFGTDDTDDAGDWTLVPNGGSGAVATGAQFNTAGTELTMTVPTDIAQDANLTLEYNGDANVVLVLKQGADEDGTVTIRAEDTNNIKLANTTATVTIADANNSANLAANANIVCAETIDIDTANRSLYDTTTGGDETNSTSFRCDLNTTAITNISDVDYTYTDVDYSVAFTASSAALLSDGNFSLAGSTTNTISGNVQTITLDTQNATSAINKSYNYNVSTSGDLTAGNFNTVGKTTVDGVITAGTADTTTINLNTFTATVKYFRASADATTETSVRLFNDSSVDAAYTMTVTTKDGTTLDVVTTTDVVPANGAIAVSASTIKALVLAQQSVVLGNGFNVTINYTDVAKGDGDASATQQDASGKYGIRVNHNNPNASTTYQGL